MKGGAVEAPPGRIRVGEIQMCYSQRVRLA
jgi:hypothetical protein